MASLKDIRAGITAAIKSAIPQITCTGYLLQNFAPPAVEIEFNGIDYHRAMHDGLQEWEFLVRGLHSSSTMLDEQAQRNLDDWVDDADDSIKEALEADRTLGGVVFDCAVAKVGPIKLFTPVSAPGTSYYGAEWTLRVLA